MSAVEHRRVGRGVCSCGERAPLGTDIHRWWDVHLLDERPEGCRSIHCLGIECMNECTSSHRLERYVALSQDGVTADLEAPAQTTVTVPLEALRTLVQEFAASRSYWASDYAVNRQQEAEHNAETQALIAALGVEGL